ncbi:MAG: hypothetical protein AAGK22_09560 [Acidobacteriota bacterium]
MTTEIETTESPSLGDLAQRVALMSWVPLFPIGFVALLLGLLTLARGGDRRQGLLAAVLGAITGTGWFALLLWFLLRKIESP